MTKADNRQFIPVGTRLDLNPVANPAPSLVLRATTISITINTDT